MQLEAVVGNRGIVSALKTALTANTLPHAVLITAPDGCGRNFVARSLAADYLFPSGGPGAAAVMEGQSPEVLLVQGEGKSGQIPIERIRNVRSDIFHSSLSAAGRVVLLKDAHMMAAPAANALLKVLEEPPADALFVLSARDASLLPQTIVSRCALYPLAPASEKECELALEKQVPFLASSKPIGLLAAVYGGRIGTSLLVLQEDSRYAVLQDALILAQAAADADAYTMVKIFAAYEGRLDGSRELRDMLLSDLTDVFACVLRGTLAEGLPTFSPQKAAAFLPFSMQARIQLKGNAAPKTIFTKIAVELSRTAKSISSI